MATLLSADLMQAIRPHMAKVVGPQVASVTQVEFMCDRKLELQ